MPVVRLNRSRFSKMVGANNETILRRLPYVGLDIESVDKDSIRVEYSPNRPDFGTDYGIARSLRGILGREVGLPSYRVTSSGISMKVDSRLLKVRPYIACATVTGVELDDEDIRQIISLQEDLHNGLGRRRRVAAIGLHDLDALTPPFHYKAAGPTFKFSPLGGRADSTIESILKSTPEGQAYGSAFGNSKVYPVILDDEGSVLSFPPIINGAQSAVTPKTKSLLIEVTGTEGRVVDNALAIMTTTIGEAGGAIHSVSIQGRSSRATPDLSPMTIRLDERLVREILGLDLSGQQITSCLRRSRLDVKGRMVKAPRYRVDLLHPVDVAEEVALGYGVDRFQGVYPPSNKPGSFNRFEDFQDMTSTLMAGAGMTELLTYEVADLRSLYENFGRSGEAKILVMNPRSTEHSALRDSLIPTMMSALARNGGAEYPQKVYEIGRVYAREDGRVSESISLGCLIAHSQATYSEAKMHLQSTVKSLIGKEIGARVGNHWAFADGRTASVRVDGHTAGSIGEVKPEVIDAFGLGVPVAGFELDLSRLYELLK